MKIKIDKAAYEGWKEFIKEDEITISLAKDHRRYLSKVIKQNQSNIDNLSKLIKEYEEN